MFSGIVRNMFTLTNTGVMQQSMRITGESLPLSIFRSFSRSLQTNESEIMLTKNTEISGYKIGRVRGQVWGKCSLLSSPDEDSLSRATAICEDNARLDMIESAQRMKADAIVGVRFRGHVEISVGGDTVVRECRGDAVTLIKDDG